MKCSLKLQLNVIPKLYNVETLHCDHITGDFGIKTTSAENHFLAVQKLYFQYLVRVVSEK